MAWRLAKSLVALRDQINQMSPNRSKISDGTIGDVAHAKTKSEHNPDKDGIVRALDVTHDPVHGIDGRKLAEALLASRDKRLLYVISNGEIGNAKPVTKGGKRYQAFEWSPYKGKNRHDHHMHISVIPGAAGDAAGPWKLDMAVAPAKAAKPPSKPRNPLLVIGNKGPDVGRLQVLLNKAGAKLTVDEDFGERTERAVKAFQRKAGIVVDGKVGAQTWEALSS